MSVTLRKKKTKKGLSLYLDIHYKGRRHYQFLNLYLKGADQAQVLALAKEIRKQTELELIAGRHNVNLDYKGEVDFIPFHLKYEHQKHFRVYRACIEKLKLFSGKSFLPCREITEDFCKRFLAYLNKNLKGESPHGYFKTFKRMLKDATRAGHFLVSPANDIINKNVTANELKKEVLFLDEIDQLYNTKCGNDNIKRAFLFALNTGLRLIDIRELKWTNIDKTNNVLKFSQSKTGRQNVVPLNDNSCLLLEGLPQISESVFILPTTAAINESLKVWVGRTTIKKKVTFGVSRHSFVSNILFLTGNLKLAGSLAGHSSIKMTEKYTHIANEQKRKAVDSMPKFK